MRIILTVEDFAKLTAGQVVEQDGAEIILEDIGYIEMMNIILDNSKD